jgi:type I restriction enzyme S subunit
MQLPIPHPDIQREIVKEYNTIKNRIALNQQLIQKLEETAQAIYREWFVEGVDLENLPEGWRVGKLSDIATIVMGQSPEGDTYNKNNNGMIFYQGRTDFGHRFPDITTYTTNPKKKALKDDILISVRAPVGDLNISTQDCAIGRGIGALRSKLKCNSHLFYTLQNLKSHFEISDGEGTIFGSINKDDLHNLEVVYSESKIKDFDRIVSSIDYSIKNYSFQNQKLTELKSLLLSKLATVE